MINSSYLFFAERKTSKAHFCSGAFYSTPPSEQEKAVKCSTVYCVHYSDSGDHKTVQEAVRHTSNMVSAFRELNYNSLVRSL